MSRTSPDQSATTNPADRDAPTVAPEGRRSPQTYVRNVEGPTGTPSPNSEFGREYNVPIRLTHQPAVVGPRAPIISTTVSTPLHSEREPFLPRQVDSPNFDNSQFRPQTASPASTGPKQLALIEAMPEQRGPAVDDGWRGKVARVTHIGNQMVREGLAEFLGSFILIIFGNGAVAEVVLSQKLVTSSAGVISRVEGVNDFFSINIAYGLAVAFGIYVAGGVSGGHLNPAVTLAMAVLGRLKWRKVPIYFLAQYLGCFIASGILHAIYYDAIKEYDGGERITPNYYADNETYTHPNYNATAQIFASYPQPFLTWYGGLTDQIFATSFFLIGIMAIIDERNMGPHKGVVPLLIGFLITAIGLSYGFNCGYPVNPARDLGPRIYTAIAGWGLEPFQFNNHNWFWIPVIGPHLGALLGVAMYQLFIGNQWPALQRAGIELQVVRKGGDEYELVKASHVRSGDVTVPVSLSTKEGQRLLEVR